MRRWLGRLPIRGKLLLLASIVACVALVISGTVLVYYTYAGNAAALHERLQTQARIAAIHSAAALSFEDVEAARSTLDALVGDDAILAAEIQRQDGSSFVERVFGAQSLAELRSGSHVLHFVADVHLGERLGSVHVWASKHELDALLMRALIVLAAATLLSFAISIFAASRLQRIISGPILALAGTAEEVSRSRDYTLRVRATTEDEVGKLVGAFNAMLAQTDAQAKELLAYQAELESKVEVRTAELAAALRDAQAAARAKADFLANMSHEIRTPMNGVLGMLELMEDEGLDAQRRSMLSTARNSAEALLGIINDVLDFSKIDAGKLTLEQIDVELQPLAEEVATLFARQANAKGVELTCLVEPGLPRLLRGDPVRLRQILSNLLGNAVKFTERGEVSLSLRASSVGDRQIEVEFCIRDTGIGMSPQTVAGLFRSFSQADTSTTRKYGGTGLGLAITRRLIEAMHGTISVDSRLGEGSAFTVRVPMQVVVGDQRSATADFTDLKVLAIDDNATNRLVLDQYLRAARIRSEGVESAQRALSILREAAAQGAPFDLILLDYHMPGMDGLEFLRELRADPRLTHTKCIMLSSIGDRQADVEELAIAAWLSKPVRQPQLYSTIAMVAGMSAGWSVGAGHRSAGARSQRAVFNARVLLVEDNIVNQQVASRMLASFGLNTHIASDGAEAVARLRSEAFDLVFMDCQMPVLDGYEATRAIRAWERNEHRTRVPIVAMTANAMQGDRERCLAAGMDDYITKPVRKEALATALNAWLSVAPAEQSTQVASGVAESDRELDEQAFERLYELFGAEVSDVILSYLQDCKTQLQAMNDAVAREDWASVGRGAHSLKSSSRAVGASSLAEVAERLEMCVRGAEERNQASGLFSELLHRHARIEPLLRARGEVRGRKLA